MRRTSAAIGDIYHEHAHTPVLPPPQNMARSCPQLTLAETQLLGRQTCQRLGLPKKARYSDTYIYTFVDRDN